MKTPPAFVDSWWIGGAFTSPEERSPEMKAALRGSDELITELMVFRSHRDRNTKQILGFLGIFDVTEVLADRTLGVESGQTPLSEFMSQFEARLAEAAQA